MIGFVNLEISVIFLFFMGCPFGCISDNLKELIFSDFNSGETTLSLNAVCLAELEV